MFSTRAPGDLTPNRHALLLAELRAQGVAITDLTLSNPTDAGLEYAPDLLVPLADPAALRYEPAPLGMPAAREAAASEYARRGVTVPADRIALTASTSEAYSLLFKLLCDPGDEVLVPVPSYPLFEHLTALDAVRPVSYPIEYHGRWSLNLDALERAVTPRTRAVLVVSPNNPTGSFLTGPELDAVSALCARRQVALIGDEVFADYVFDGRDRGPSVVQQDAALAFSLGGLSKAAGLPQVKLGWMAVAGPSALVTEAIARLELICDTYLSVSTPVQRAAPALLQRAPRIRERIQRRTIGNRAALAQLVAMASDIEVLEADGGWYAVVRVPATVPEEQLALELLRTDHVLVHPGYFFDFPHEAFVVLSLLSRPDDFSLGVRRLVARATVAL
ncbi:MAG TPA: pyridoxal phosphate-dependent aminotransferase [Vicinamibacterales bacterium]|nr:pyridoxal phosphate-dependent aminotransferase [Vicinamibacterales bacterium]